MDFRDTRSATGVDRREIDANRFAAGLLMPEEWVYEAFKELILGAAPKDTTEDFVVALARRFEVSSEAMRYRLVNLGILDTADERARRPSRY